MKVIVITLNLAERLSLTRYLPNQGNIPTIEFLEEIESKTVFTTEETKECEISFNGRQLVWKKNVDKSIEFTEKEFDYIKEHLMEAEKNGLLYKEDKSLYFKFVK